MTDNEVLIKSKKRVQQHGEVFTPKAIVDAMVTLPGLHDAIIQASTTVLEPSVGEGAFLINILDRRLILIAERFPDDLIRFENYALLALSTLYGIELLEDNVKKCTMNLFHTFHDFYKQYAADLNQTTRKKVEDSAKTIISANIVQGDFLKRTNAEDKPIIFSHWKTIRLNKATKNIKVIRTELSLQQIYDEFEPEPGSLFSPTAEIKQLSLFDVQEEDLAPPSYRYTPVPITEVYKQEMEEINL